MAKKTNPVIELDDLLMEDIDELVTTVVDIAESARKTKTKEVINEELVVPLEMLEESAIVPTSYIPTTGIGAMIDDIEATVAKPTWIIYGKNGTGKTKIGGTAEGALVLAAEDGTMTLRKYTGIKRKWLHIKKWSDLEEVYWLLRKGVILPDGIQINTKSGPFLVRYLVFDTITKLAQVCLRSVVLGAAASDPTKDVISATLRDWGTMSQKMTYWLMQFKDLPVQLVWLMQEVSSGETDDEEFSVTVDVNKALRNSLLAEADVIGRTGITTVKGEPTFVIRFTPNPKFVTKDRTGVLGNSAYANPNLDTLNEKIEGGLR